MTDPYERERTGIPRWLKVSGIAALLLALLVAVLLLVGGGGHGPRLHSGSGVSDGAAAAVTVLAAPQQLVGGRR
jgi:hypothetical protein